MIVNESALNLINSPVRKIGAELSRTYRLSEYAWGTEYYRFDEKLIKFSIERIGDETKFFGFGVCQKLNFHIRDPLAYPYIQAGQWVDIDMYPADNKVDVSWIGAEYGSGNYCITEVHKDENNGELSITAYDVIYQTSQHYYSEVVELYDINTYSLQDSITYNEETASYEVDGNTTELTLRDIADACLGLLGGFIEIDESLEEAFSLSGNFNLEGSETIRDILDDIAEATQTIYYVKEGRVVYFRRLDRDGEPVYTIDKSKYFTLDSKTNRRLGKLVSATSLGDNLAVETDATGTTQYIRDNFFWDLRDDRETLLQNGFELVKGLTYNQFDCDWRGNWLLEPGDKIGLVTKDDEVVYSYLINDTITYDGSYSQRTKWEYAASDTDEADNPANLGDALKKTYATVDKVNKEIDIVASLSKENEEAISSIRLTTDSITSSVESVESVVNSLTQQMEELTKRVETIVTPEDLQIQIKEVLQNGITEVTTTTGFTFNQDGLNVSKTGSEMNTTITEDGMIVSRETTPMLVANNEGVEAINLKASTYLIIGLNSRFEDYDNKTRTGCFWIGG